MLFSTRATSCTLWYNNVMNWIFNHKRTYKVGKVISTFTSHQFVWIAESRDIPIQIINL